MATAGSTTARGYGAEHQQARRDALQALAISTALGKTTRCTRCRQPVLPGQRLDLDHRDDRRGYRGLAHRSCNRRAGAHKRNATRPQRPDSPAITRPW